MRFVPKNIVIVAGINELRSYFCTTLPHCLLYILKQLFNSVSVASSGYLP